MRNFVRSKFSRSLVQKKNLIRQVVFTLREKCSNTEFLLVRIFLYLDWIQEIADQKKVRVWTLFTQCQVKIFTLIMICFTYDFRVGMDSSKSCGQKFGQKLFSASLKTNECQKWTTRVRYERCESDTSEKFLILVTTRVKTYFHTHILAISQMKDYKERNNFILRTN